MAINFPDSPTIGDEFTGGGFTWTWNGSSWEKVSSLSPSNDFGVNLSSATTYNLDSTYPAGIYAITITNNDASFDIYAISTNGESCGYTNSNTIEITDNFNQLSILGVPADERILFYFQGAVATASGTGNALKGGAFIDSIDTSALPNIDDTAVISGGNFATDVEVVFVGQDTAESAAKSVVRSSSTELIVTRPDSFAVANSPYSVKVINPGVTPPSGSGLNIISNAVSAGTLPSWSTGSSVAYNSAAPTSIALVASDTEASDIDYSIVSGTLPEGLTLDQETGVISGTFSGSASEGDSTSITFRATDAGGNFVDKSISLVVNDSPVWTTSAGVLPNAVPGVGYNLQLVADGGLSGTILTYTLQSGSLPAGITLSSAGLLSGTSTETNGTNQTFTVRVSDEYNAFADREFSILTRLAIDYLVLAGGGGGGSNINSSAWETPGGGGAGGYRSSVDSSGGGAAAETALNLATGTAYTITVGAGGSVNQNAAGSVGTASSISSTAGSVTTVGGGGGGGGNSAERLPTDGGSGGGGHGGVGGALGTQDEGFNGGGGAGGSSGAGGGGGGAGAIGGGSSSDNGGEGGAGVSSSITGTLIGRGGGGGGGARSTSRGTATDGGGEGACGQDPALAATAGAANKGGGGGGGAVNYSGGVVSTGKAGGSGVVILKYPSAFSIGGGSGLTFSTDSSSVPGYKISTFTQGTGNVTFS